MYGYKIINVDLRFEYLSVDVRLHHYYCGSPVTNILLWICGFNIISVYVRLHLYYCGSAVSILLV
jgi:hypothetical protein